MWHLNCVMSLATIKFSLQQISFDVNKMKSHCKYLESTQAINHLATHSFFYSPSLFIRNRFFLNTTYLVHYFFWGSGCPRAYFRGEGFGLHILRDPEKQHPQKQFKLQQDVVMHRPLNLTLLSSDATLDPHIA